MELKGISSKSEPIELAVAKMLFSHTSCTRLQNCSRKFAIFASSIFFLLLESIKGHKILNS